MRVDEMNDSKQRDEDVTVIDEWVTSDAADIDWDKVEWVAIPEAGRYRITWPRQVSE